MDYWPRPQVTVRLGVEGEAAGVRKGGSTTADRKRGVVSKVGCVCVCLYVGVCIFIPCFFV